MMLMTHGMLQLWWILLNGDFALVLSGVLRLGSSDCERASLLCHRHKCPTIQLKHENVQLVANIQVKHENIQLVNIHVKHENILGEYSDGPYSGET